jgi:rhodanese-related sulfurtransferase
MKQAKGKGGIMGLFDLFGKGNIDDGVRTFNETPNAVLLDVRTPQEYAQGHIPQARNVPLQQISEAETVVADKSVPVFCYCHSGVRSAQAVRALKQMGYADTRNIGGITSWHGELA